MCYIIYVYKLSSLILLYFEVSLNYIGLHSDALSGPLYGFSVAYLKIDIFLYVYSSFFFKVSLLVSDDCNLVYIACKNKKAR